MAHGEIDVFAAEGFGLAFVGLVVGAFALKFAKVGILAAAGLGAAFAKLFRRRPKAAQGGVSQGGTTSEAPSASGPSHAASAPRDDV